MAQRSAATKHLLIILCNMPINILSFFSIRFWLSLTFYFAGWLKLLTCSLQWCQMMGIQRGLLQELMSRRLLEKNHPHWNLFGMMKIPKLFTSLYLISGLLSILFPIPVSFLAFIYCWFEIMKFSSRAFVPAVLLGEVEPKSNEQHAKGREQSSVRIWILYCPFFKFTSVFSLFLLFLSGI